MSIKLEVGDEEAFFNFEEKIVYDFFKLWSTKPGMEGIAVMDVCAKLEDHIYHEALKEHNLAATANVWSKQECIQYFQEKCDVLLRGFDAKDLNWRKVFDESKNNIKHAYQMISKPDKERKYKANSDELYRQASKASGTKSRKSTVATAASGGGLVKEKGPGKRKSNPKSIASATTSADSIPIMSSLSAPKGPKAGKSSKKSASLSADGDVGVMMISSSSQLVAGEASLAIDMEVDDNLDFGFDFSGDNIF